MRNVLVLSYLLLLSIVVLVEPTTAVTWFRYIDCCKKNSASNISQIIVINNEISLDQEGLLLAESFASSFKVDTSSHVDSRNDQT